MNDTEYLVTPRENALSLMKTSFNLKSYIFLRDKYTFEYDSVGDMLITHDNETDLCACSTF